MLNTPSTLALPHRSARTLAVVAVVFLGGCANLDSNQAAKHAAPPAAPVPAPSPLAPYLATLAAMAPGDPARQQAELAAALAATQQTPSASATLRYALALGSAGSTESNPVQAKRLLGDLLAGPNDLPPEVREFAAGYLREFDARVALYAELARQREESEQKLRISDSSAAKRADALAAENARLKKQLAEAERKLDAVADMERALQEQTQQSEQDAAPPP